MKYKVTITQQIKYGEQIVGIFDNLADVQQFIETVMEHFEKVSVGIDVIAEESEGVEVRAE